MGDPVLQYKRPRWVPEPMQTPGSSQPAIKRDKMKDPAVGGKNRSINSSYTAEGGDLVFLETAKVCLQKDRFATTFKKFKCASACETEMPFDASTLCKYESWALTLFPENHQKFKNMVCDRNK